MKYLYLSLLLFAAVTCRAQDTYYLRANFARVAVKDSALLICTIGDQDPATKTYPFKQVFNTGELYMTGQTSNGKNIAHDVETTEYYLNGKVLSTTKYQDRRPVMITTYYPNGQLYLVQEYQYYAPNPAKPAELRRKELILTCNDEDGKALTQNGNGAFKNYFPENNPKFGRSGPVVVSHTYENGNIVNGLRDGKWTGSNETLGFSYIEEYEKGLFVKGRSIDKDRKTFDYTEREKIGEFPGGLSEFYVFIGKECRYPQSAMSRKIQGRVFVTFAINVDGSLSDIKVIRSPDSSLSDEAVRVIGKSPNWKPGEQHGMAIRQQYTVPLSFTL